MAFTRESEEALALARLKIALREAQPTRGDISADPRGTEDRRIDAVKELHAAHLALRRSGAKPMGHEAEILFLQLKNFFAREWDRALNADGPEEIVAAISKFFVGRGTRGRTPAENRRQEIAAMVDERVARGEKLAAACEAVGNEIRPALSKKAVEDAYYGRGLSKAARERRKRKVKLVKRPL